MGCDEKLYLKVKNEAEEWLFRVPGVYGVALGPKTVAGQLTCDLAIQVYVKAKRPLDELAPNELIPSEINGIKTDVIAGGGISTTAGLTIAPFRNCPSGGIAQATKTKPVVITTDADHGLENGDEVMIVGVSTIGLAPVKIQRAAGDDSKTFSLPNEDRSMEPEYTGGGTWFKACRPNQLCCCTGGNITEATNTNPVKITTDSPHGLLPGDRVRIDEIKDMFQLRNEEYSVKKVPDKTSFELDVNGTTFRMGTHESGKWSKVCIAKNGLINAATRTNPIRVSSGRHGLASGDRVHIFDVQGMDEINNFRNSEPFTVQPSQQDPQNIFELKDVDGRNYHAYTTGGFWVRIREDKRAYCRVRGGIRVAIQNENATILEELLFDDLPTSFQTELDRGGRPSNALRGRFDTHAIQLSEQTTVEVMSPGDRWHITDKKRVYVVLKKDGKLKVFGREKQKGSLGTKINSGGTEVFTRTILAYGTLGCVVEDPAGTKYLLSNYHVLYSVPGESNVHHPSYSKCKSQKIGEVTRHADPGTNPARPGTVDAAIAKLDDQGKAVPEIVDIGPVNGSVAVTLSDIQLAPDRMKGFRVRKRGISTLLTEGLISGLNGNFQDPDTNVFLRDQMIITPMVGAHNGTFAAPGDSGSAVVNDKNEVVGLLLGVGGSGEGFASPIKPIEAQLGVIVTRHRPQPQPHTSIDTDDDDEERSRVALGYPELLTQVVSEVSGSEAGSQFLSVVQRNYSEVETLVHHNKRIAAIWRRNEGPVLLRELHWFVNRRDRPLPQVLNGKPLMECVERILAAFKKFGSSRLVSDITQFSPEVLKLVNLSYSDLLVYLTAKSVA